MDRSRQRHDLDNVQVALKHVVAVTTAAGRCSPTLLPAGIPK
ncbi:hypothetical protein [uncultured Corynebacterium sp.]|nr:hypothetical protein [uncultured Corynebacterium sp.]